MWQNNNGIETHDYNLNIRRYVDNTPEPEPQDVQAHLLGGIPQNEVEARGENFAKFGLATDVLFEPHRSGYLAFRETIQNKAAIKSHIEADPKVSQTLLTQAQALETWWQIAQKDFALLEGSAFNGNGVNGNSRKRRIPVSISSWWNPTGKSVSRSWRKNSRDKTGQAMALI